MTSSAFEQGIQDRQARAWRGRLRHGMTYLHPFLPAPTFVTFHYIYFITTCLIATLVFYGSATPFKSVRFIDAVFLTVSAMTEAGLNTINLSELNTWQQVILFVLIIMGSAIFVSGAVIHIRKRAFETKLQELADSRQKRLLQSSRPLLSFSRSKRRSSQSESREAKVAAGVVRGQAIHDPSPDQPYIPSFPRRERTLELLGDDVDAELPALQSPVPRASNNHIHFDEDVRRPPLNRANNVYRRSHRHFISNSGVGTHGFAAHPQNSGPLLYHAEVTLNHPIKTIHEEPRDRRHSRLDRYTHTINGYLGRNSQFSSLTEKERRELGGIEYDALCVLSYIVPLYFILFQLIGALGCGAWMSINLSETTRANGLNPFWTGAFFAVSAFNNSGMALLDANATVLQDSYYMLLTLSLLILAGNTCFPPFLRLIIWTLKMVTPERERWRTWRTTLQFILDHPRRVYTNLFPADATWWLVLSLVLLNGADWFAFEVFNIGNPTVEGIAPRYRAIDGLFQAFAVRAGGFYVVTISALGPGTLVLYVLMMYLSAFPVTMAIRNTNVYEERSLAIFSEEDGEDTTSPSTISAADDKPSKRTAKLKRTFSSLSGISGTSTNRQQPMRTSWSRQDFVRQQLHNQLGHDLWWLSLAILLITIIETRQYRRDPVDFSVFNIIFEVVSAYGTVGISIGVPWAAYSFSGAWHTGSKLILCAVMLRGRHRGLPVAIDRAILLPDHTLWWAEEEDGRIRRSRTNVLSSSSRAPSLRARPSRANTSLYSIHGNDEKEEDNEKDVITARGDDDDDHDNDNDNVV